MKEFLVKSIPFLLAVIGWFAINTLYTPVAGALDTVDKHQIAIAGLAHTNAQLLKTVDTISSDVHNINTIIIDMDKRMAVLDSYRPLER